MSHSPIDTVTFDLWFTLIAHDELYDDRLREYRYSGVARALRDAGHDVAREDIVAAFESSGRCLEGRWSACRDIDTDEQVGILLQCLDIEPEPGLVAAVADPYANAVLHVEPFAVNGAREALEALQDSGLRLALISNTGRTPGSAMRKVMGRLGLLDFFEVTTFSNEAGYLKPDRRIFEQTLSRMGAAPEHTVHVGDHAVLDVRGAKDYGMRSIRVLQYAGMEKAGCEPDVAIDTLYDLPDAIFQLME
jgi:putative hydrolase of the HAD superfamily